MQRRRDELILRRLLRPAHYHADTGANTRPGEPEWLRLLRIVRPSAGPEIVAEVRLPIPESARALVDGSLSSAGWDVGKRVVAIAPGSNMQSKRWPEAYYAEVGSSLIRRHPDIALAVVGGAEDKPLGDRLCSQWDGRARNFCGTLDVYGSAALLSRCAAYVGNDSGVMHLAAFAGIRCVAIFSARDTAGKWDPVGERHIVLREHPECEGCMLRTCVKEGNKCLTRIGVQRVLAEIERVL
jgi:ADP-heptose:LPS heptosyltransferase